MIESISGNEVNEISRTGLVGEWHFEGDERMISHICTILEGDHLSNSAWKIDDHYSVSPVHLMLAVI